MGEEIFMRNTRISASNNTIRLQKMILAALFAALAFSTLFFVRIPVAFLTFDLKDVFITFGAMLLGPIYGLAIALIVASVEMVTVSSGSGPYGLLMNFVSSGAFAFTAALIYKYYKTLLGAAIGLGFATILTTAIMMGMNMLIVPLFMEGVTRARVQTMIVPLLLPFNFAKYTASAATVMMIYKPLSVALLKAKVLPAASSDNAQNYKFNRKSVIIIGISVTILIAALLILFIHLDGRVEIF